MREDNLKFAENLLTAILIFALPVFLLTSFSNPFVTPKLIILSLLLVLIFIIKAVRNFITAGKGLVFHTSIFDVPVVLMVVAYVASSFVVSPNRMEAFWLPGTASFVIGGAFLYFVVNQMGEASKKYAKMALVSSAGVIAFMALLTSVGIFKNIEGLPAYMRSDAFSTLGSLVSAIIYMVATLPIAVDQLIKNKNMATKAVTGVVAALSVIAILLSGVTLAKNWGATSLPGLTNSWIVATESLKGQPLFGVGPGNYLTAFTRFIPLNYNATSRWTLRFANAQDFYLTVITETGLLGFAALTVLLFAAYKKIRGTISDTSLFEHAPLVLLLIAFAFLPSSPVLVILLFVLLGLETKGHVVQLFGGAHVGSERLEGKISNIAVSVPTIVIAIFLAYLTVQATRGEIVYQKALNLVGTQDGKGAYDTIRSAIDISPYSDRYHLSYSQLNLALANAVAQKKTLTEDDKKTISQLVQQAIREGRSAVLLNQTRAGNWENLAAIYKAVIPLAKGADQFAIQTYSQAIALDPINPNTRVALGGVFYSLKRYEEAIDVFKLAAAAKPDLANSHYNLAIAYRDNGQYDKALAELTGSLTLVSKDSKDYDVLKKEIENVQSKAPKKTTPAQSGDSLTAPDKIDDSSKLNPQVQIPSDATPPSPVSTATPAPTVSATPTATPIK